MTTLAMQAMLKMLMTRRLHADLADTGEVSKTAQLIFDQR